MKSKIAVFSFLTLLVCHPTDGQAAKRAPTFNETLQSTVPSFGSAGRPMVEVVLALAYRYKVPLGLEYVTRDAVQNRLDLRIGRKSLWDVFTSIVTTVPGYEVDFFHGLVDIYSADERRDPSNLFNTVVTQFPVAGVDTDFADADLFCALGRQLYPRAAGCGGAVREASGAR